MATALWLLCAATAGILLALRAFGEAAYPLGPARIEVRTEISTSGTVDAYIPLADWGVRTHPFSAPISLNARLVAVDREAARGALRAPGGANARLRSIQSDVPGVARSALRRAALAALLGGAAGGTVGGLSLAAVGRRRLLIPVGTIAGAGIAGILIVGCGLLLRSPDYGAFRTPTFYAHGAELPRLLAASDSFSVASASYESSYQQAVAGLDALIGAAAGGKPAAARSFLVGSDIHANWLTLPTFSQFADDRPVFLVGDYSQQGTPIEAAIADQAADLGRPVVVVSGNHDTPIVMRTFARAGAVVVTHNGRLDPSGRVHGPPVFTVAGVLVAGYEDPLERQAGSYGHRLDFSPAELDAYRAAVERWFDSLTPRPQIVLVHDARVAGTLRLHVAAESKAPLLILTGHDHQQHIDRTGNTVVVDGGTLGAGGVFGVGTQQAGFAQVYLDDDGWPAAVDLISADPITGNASAQHRTLTEHPIPPPTARDESGVPTT